VFGKNANGVVLANAVDTIADLATASKGTAIQVLGFHTKGDGGGGVFFYDAEASKTEHNGGTVIDPDKVSLITNWEANQTTYFTAATTGVGVWKREYSGAVNVKWFGAKGNGVADDTLAVQNAIKTNLYEYEGDGDTYVITSSMSFNRGDIVLSNIVFDVSGIPDVPGSIDYIISFTGVQDSAKVLTADLNEGGYTVSIGDTSTFTADDSVYLESTDIFETTQGVVLGQVSKIKSVDSLTQLTLYKDVLYNFTTSATATISKLSTQKNIKVINCGFIGASSNTQSVLNFDKCEDVIVENCWFEYCDYVACRISRTINFMANNCSVRYARAVGTSYGFAVTNGSYSVKIQNSFGEDLRHFVTVGDNEGVNLFVTVQGCHISSCLDAGIDAHAACDFMTVNGNTIEGSSFDSGQLDGIIFQGLNCVITNNTIVNCRRYSLFHQMLPDIGVGSCVIANNNMDNNRVATGSAIRVSNESNSVISVLNGVSITGNVLGNKRYCNHWKYNEKCIDIVRGVGTRLFIKYNKQCVNIKQYTKNKWGILRILIECINRWYKK
jgi:hypothetical protein